MTQYIIETPLGPATVSYSVHSLNLAERTIGWNPYGKHCEMTLPHPKSGKPWRLSWEQSNGSIGLWDVKGKLASSNAAPRSLGPEWGETVRAITTQAAPAIAAWFETPDGQRARQNGIAARLRTIREHSASSIAYATERIAEEQGKIELIDAWLADLAPPFPGGTTP